MSDNPYQPGDLRHTFVALVDACALACKIDHERREATHWRNAARPRCGNCTKWMTDACPSEYHEKGRRRGPHMNRFTCEMFDESSIVQEWREKAAQHEAHAAILTTGGTP